jgi:hypothetical protein
MESDGVFSAEMPDEPFQAIVPLDADTAERLLSARLDPDDAPPGYAEVARLLQAAAAPADRIELTGQAAALDAFRRTRPSPAQRPAPPGGARGRPTQSWDRPVRPPRRLAGSTGRPGGSRGRRNAARAGALGARGRLVALALAGAVAAGAVGVWTAGGAPFSRELGSPSGGPGAGGSGSATPGSGPYGSGGSGSGGNGSGADATGSLRPAWTVLDSAPGPTPVTNGRPPVPTSTREPATARHPGGVTSRGGSTHASKHTHPGKQPKPKPPKAKPPRSKSPKPDED